MEYNINLKEGSQPRVEAARKIPFALRKRVKKELDDVVKNDVLEKTNEPTEYARPIVTVVKRDGRMRIYMDPSYLNQFIKREHCYIPTGEEILAEL